MARKYADRPFWIVFVVRGEVMATRIMSAGSDVFVGRDPSCDLVCPELPYERHCAIANAHQLQLAPGSVVTWSSAERKLVRHDGGVDGRVIEVVRPFVVFQLVERSVLLFVRFGRWEWSLRLWDRLFKLRRKGFPL